MKYRDIVDFSLELAAFIKGVEPALVARLMEDAERRDDDEALEFLWELKRFTRKIKRSSS